MEHVVSHQSYATRADTNDYEIGMSLFTTADSELSEAASKEDLFLVSITLNIALQ